MQTFLRKVASEWMDPDKAPSGQRRLDRAAGQRNAMGLSPVENREPEALHLLDMWEPGTPGQMCVEKSFGKSATFWGQAELRYDGEP